MSEKATRAAYGEALAELGAVNEKVVVLDADLSKSTMTVTFKKEFPERFYNMGIAEANMVDVAAGMSTMGLIPFCSTFAMFGAGRVYEQIRNSIGYPHLNVKLCMSHAGVSVGPHAGDPGHDGPLPRRCQGDPEGGLCRRRDGGPGVHPSGPSGYPGARGGPAL